VQSLVQDIGSGAITAFPQEWFQALVWGLADITAFENQVPVELSDRIQLRAAQYKEDLVNWDEEYASVYFQYDAVRNG
jgi:hypothetical protein